MGTAVWRRRAGRLGACAVLLSGLAQAWAQQPAPADDPAAWLSRIQRAAANRSYEGTLSFSAGGSVSSSRIVHICAGQQSYERIEALNGEVRRQYRHNDQVLTLWPQSKLAVLEQQAPVAAFPALPAAGLRPVDSYELRSMGVDRVAGHEADVLLFKPRDALRFAQRLWTERESGLLLRADTIGPRGEVLESSAFSDLVIGGKLSADRVVAPMRKLDGYRTVRAQAVRAQLDAEGWALSRPVPGFQLVSCVKRPLDAAADGAAASQVLQSVFSDGLTHVSVFVEPYDAARHRPMRTSAGATHTLMTRRGDWWLTIVGDVPMATVQQFETLFERRR